MVSFKSESVKQRIEKRRKAQSSSFGIVIAFLILVIVIGVFGAMKFWKSALDEEIGGYDEQINEIKGKMQVVMNSEEADFYKRMDLVRTNIYKKHSSVAVLNEIENVIVPRVVLLSFMHSVDNQGEQIVITADADEFYLMAQQIEEFKKSEFFDNVRASDTSKDNVGRIVFTISADVVDKNYTLYSEDNQGMTQQQNAQQEMQLQPQVLLEGEDGQETQEEQGTQEVQEESQQEASQQEEGQVQEGTTEG